MAWEKFFEAPNFATRTSFPAARTSATGIAATSNSSPKLSCAMRRVPHSARSAAGRRDPGTSSEAPSPPKV